MGINTAISECWTCPRCGRRFQKNNQQHVCETWTPEDHLQGKSEAALQMYARFVALIAACGDFDYSVTKANIGFRGPRRGFAGVMPTAKGLRGFMDLMQPVEDPRISNVSPYTQNLFVHQFTITSLDQLDETFAGWLKEAYSVGQGAHLNTA